MSNRRIIIEVTDNPQTGVTSTKVKLEGEFNSFEAIGIIECAKMSTAKTYNQLGITALTENNSNLKSDEQ